MRSLKQEIIGSPTAPVVVLFGGHPERRHEVIELLENLGDVTIYGTLSEDEGLEKLWELGNIVNLVLIGGRYTKKQRQRIQAWISKHNSIAKITQPGQDYPYSNEAILADSKVKLSTANISL